MKTFAQRLKDLMKEEHMNQTMLSNRLGLSKSTISGYLSGCAEPPEKKKEKIAQTLDRPADYFRMIEVDEAVLEDEGYRLPVNLAARLMGIRPTTLKAGLRSGSFPFGYAILNEESNFFTYWISRIKFVQETGIPIPAKDPPDRGMKP